MNEGGEGIPVQADVVDASSEPNLQPQAVKPTILQKPPVNPSTQQMYGKDVSLGSQKSYDDPEQQRRQDVRAFSKSTEEGRWARRETASKILNERGKIDAQVRETK